MLTIHKSIALAVLVASPVMAQSTASLANVGTLPPLKVFDPSYIDKSVNACTDFFQFANGAWLKSDTIPAAFSSSGVSKDMTDRNELVVRSVLDDAMKNRASAPAGSTQRKLGTYYASCMDSSRAERDGITPIKPELNRIASINSRTDLVREIGALHKMGVNAAFRFFPDSDPKDAAHYIEPDERFRIAMARQ